MSAKRACAVVAALTVVLCGGTAARAGPVLPDFSPSDFAPGAPITNPFFPLTPGTTFRAGGTVVDPEDGGKSQEVDEDFVTSQTKMIAGVAARVVQSRVFEDGVLAEDTRDYYAQDKAGNVWYMGEDTTAFTYDDKGNVVGRDTSGSWLTGVRGAKPGYIMPAHPTVGFSHYQEFAPADEAVDQAQVVSLNETVTVPFGHFTGVLKTQEQSAAEPGVLENKYYAAGVGLILTEEDIDAAGRPLDSLTLRSVTTATIPLPPAPAAAAFAVLLLAAPAGLRAVFPRRRTRA